MAESIVTVRLMSTNIYTRRRCLFCAELSNKDAVNAEVFSATVNVDPEQRGEQRTGLIVCTQCLALDPGALRRTIQAEAEWHRERGAELQHIAEHPPVLPTPADYQAACEQHDREWKAARRGSPQLADLDCGSDYLF